VQFCTIKLEAETSSRMLLTSINPTKSPASGAGNVSELRLMSQVGKVHEVVCA